MPPGIYSGFKSGNHSVVHPGMRCTRVSTGMMCTRVFTRVSSLVSNLESTRLSTRYDINPGISGYDVYPGIDSGIYSVFNRNVPGYQLGYDVYPSINPDMANMTRYDTRVAPEYTTMSRNKKYICISTFNPNDPYVSGQIGTPKATCHTVIFQGCAYPGIYPVYTRVCTRV